MGGQQSRGNVKVDEMDLPDRAAFTKVGKRKAMDVTLLDAQERAELIQRSVGAGIEQRRALRKKEELARKKTFKEGERMEEDADKFLHVQSKIPKVTRVAGGAEWKAYVEDCWQSPKRTVVHTTIPPPGKLVKDIHFVKPKLLQKTTRKLEVGEIPVTAVAPCDCFEGVVEPACMRPPWNFPPHILVVDAFPPRPSVTEEEFTL